MNEDIIIKINGLLRFHYKINPEQLNDEEWIEKWKELQWVLRFEARRIDAKSDPQI